MCEQGWLVVLAGLASFLLIEMYKANLSATSIIPTRQLEPFISIPDLAAKHRKGRLTLIFFSKSVPFHEERPELVAWFRVQGAVHVQVDDDGAAVGATRRCPPPAPASLRSVRPGSPIQHPLKC